MVNVATTSLAILITYKTFCCGMERPKLLLSSRQLMLALLLYKAPRVPQGEELSPPVVVRDRGGDEELGMAMPVMMMMMMMMMVVMMVKMMVMVMEIMDVSWKFDSTGTQYLACIAMLHDYSE